ncbi:MAG: transposase [Planctomycetaceae bacterium]
MSQSPARLCVHLVFSTKHRRPLLAEPTLRSEMHAVLGELCNRLDCPVITAGGVEDHVHVACFLGRKVPLADLLKEIKRESAVWAKARAPALSDFLWQGGYAAFSISSQHIPALVEYIRNQEEHHRHETFEEELRRILLKHDVEFDERYLWD